MKTDLEQSFLETYQQPAAATYFSPGRVNLIGEHIDYNGGLVMPCAITFGTWLCLAPNNDQVIRFKSLNFPEEKAFLIQSSYQKEGPEWYHYPLGIFNEIFKTKKIEQGLDLLFDGNIPIGSGLSSSASIEVVIAYALNDYFNLGFSKLELVLMAKSVENNFIGVNSGVMDQFAVTFGEKEKAILLNCDTLDYKAVDCHPGDYALAIINTNKPRKLAESKYNERVAECQTALQQLRQEVEIDYLCDLNAEQFEQYKHLLTDPVILKRARHVITENDRVNQAAKALSDNDFVAFGQLMYASHESLQNDYEVSGQELDTIVAFCKDYEPVIGARMTGAGFGGCAIAFLKKGMEADFTEKLTEYYQNSIGYAPSVYVSDIGGGASVI